MSAPNRNLLWSQVFVDELARCGLQAVCIAPGSRSTPLVVAFAEHPDIRVYSHVDERSASFFALGLALASERPVAILCSSGTATANFHPAIIEAQHSGVPLLVLTADRPHELRASGANQTIDQVKMYGDHTLWSVDVALPEAEPPAVAVRNLRTLACRAYALANGIPKGAVHLNFPFRKPLEPTPVPTDVTDIPDSNARENAPYTLFSRGVMTPTDEQIDSLAAMLRGVSRGFIVCGPRSPGGDFPAAVMRLARAARCPVLADPLSGVRFNAAQDDELVVGGYDTFLQAPSDWDAPEIILHFGAMPSSQALDNYLNSIEPQSRVWVSADGGWADPNHRANRFIWADPTSLCKRLAERLERNPPQTDEAWLERVRAAEAACWQTVEAALDEDFFDGVVLAEVVKALPSGGKLYVGNSLPVRQLDQFGKPANKPLRVFGNRGASGIDGVVSSALGAAAADDSPLALVVGDLSFYHDLNGLLAVKRCGVKATIVVINNDGGGIFYRLPIAQFDPPFTDLFLTPHGLDFEPVVRMYGLNYHRAENRAGFQAQLQAAIASDTATVIEVPSDLARDAEKRREILRRVAERADASPISP